MCSLSRSFLEESSGENEVVLLSGPIQVCCWFGNYNPINQILPQLEENEQREGNGIISDATLLIEFVHIFLGFCGGQCVGRDNLVQDRGRKTPWLSEYCTIKFRTVSCVSNIGC